MTKYAIESSWKSLGRFAWQSKNSHQALGHSNVDVQITIWVFGWSVEGGAATNFAISYRLWDRARRGLSAKWDFVTMRATISIWIYPSCWMVSPWSMQSAPWVLIRAMSYRLVGNSDICAVVRHCNLFLQEPGAWSKLLFWLRNSTKPSPKAH